MRNQEQNQNDIQDSKYKDKELYEDEDNQK